MALPHHRHQTSLEGVFDIFESDQRLEPQKRAQAQRNFQTLIETHEFTQPNDGSYKPITLIRLTYEYALSQTSKDKFLQFFFQHMQMPVDVSMEELRHICVSKPQLTAFADILIKNFFLPCKTAYRRF